MKQINKIDYTLLKDTIDNLDETLKPICLGLLKELKFMESTLSKLKKNIKSKGVVTEMSQGSYSIDRTNPALQSYNSLIKNYTSTSKQLFDMLPKENISDDDLIFLLKQIPDCKYYDQWCSRKFTHAALWKSRDEFFHYFSNIGAITNLKHNDFEKQVKDILCADRNLLPSDIIIIEQEFKNRVKLESLYLLVSNEVVRYTDIHQEAKDSNINQTFYYVYLPKNKMDKEEWIHYKKEMVERLKDVMSKLYISPKKE